MSSISSVDMGIWRFDDHAGYGSWLARSIAVMSVNPLIPLIPLACESTEGINLRPWPAGLLSSESAAYVTDEKYDRQAQVSQGGPTVSLVVGAGGIKVCGARCATIVAIADDRAAVLAV
jgi:hypothetical protein